MFEEGKGAYIYADGALKKVHPCIEIMIASEDDLEDIEGLAPGSIAHLAGESQRWMLNLSGEWVPMQGSIGDVMAVSQAFGRYSSLDETELAGGTVIEAVGIPTYVDDVNDYSDFNLTETGWYIFARIMAKNGVEVTENTTVTGADSYVAETGADHIDLAVKFAVAAVSRKVVINWGDYTDTFIFKATDLAVRNLDYRTTFYVYDISDFATWDYAPATDAAFAGTTYYTESEGVYTPAAVKANAAVTPETYYTHSYALTEDETFVEGKTYYTVASSVYTAAEVTAGDAVTANTYYEDVYTLTTDTRFVGTAYYTKDGSTYTQAAVIGGDPHYLFYEQVYALTEDATFVDGKTYYTKEGDVYSTATVTAGEEVTADTYYEQVYALTEDATFVDGKTYYTKSGTTYSAAEVTAGAAVPTVYYIHSLVSFAGMTRNVTYRFDELIDCPVQITLPEINDDGYGAWFEIQMRHNDTHSLTVVLEDPDAKVAGNSLVNFTGGVGVLDLNYTNVDGVKLWRGMYTNSTVPTT